MPDTDIAIQDSIALTELTATEQGSVEQVFQEAKDFRSVGEIITSPLDEIISETTEVISRDPIMKVSDELADMNTNVQEVYSDIIDDDGAIMRFLKALPIIGYIANIADEKFDEVSFNLKSIEGKIQSIFSGFDTTYDSVNTSIELQKKFLDGIDANL